MKKKRKLKVVDLFAGAGGFGLGFHLTNKYKVVCSLEIDKWAVKTLNANKQRGHKIIEADIRSFNSSEKILSACPKPPDIIIGGPPCQGFSVAGPIKDPKDPRNSLFKNFAQWVEVLKPKIFIMENVGGLLNRKNEKGEKVIGIIKSTFEKIGYHVTIWELNAANYGVPQNRARVFIIGSQLYANIPKPPITHYLPEEKKSLNGSAKDLKKAITVIRAIGDLPKLKAGEGLEETAYTKLPKGEFQVYMRDRATKLFNHVTMDHTERIVKRYKEILNGLSMQEIPDELRVRKRNGNGQISGSEYNSNYRHLRPNMISYTIPASFYSNFVHPNQPRNITSREAARIQSFPDSYVFRGKRTQISSKLLELQGKDDEDYLSQYNQIGNAVPPLLAKAVANHIYRYMRRSLKAKLPKK